MSDYAHNETEKYIKKIEVKLKREYGIAQEEIEKKLNDYMEAFERKDAVKRKLLEEKKITQDDYNYWTTGQIMVGQRGDELVDAI